MGASASTNQQTIQNNILNQAYNTCPNIGTTNVIDLSGIKFEPPPDCNPPSEMIIGQTATVDANCLLTSLQSSAADIAAQLNAEAKAGLGIAVSTNINDVKNSINQITTNSCANVSTTNKATIKDTVIKSCKFQVIQDATLNVSCQINATQDLVSKIASNAATSAEGGSIWGLLFGSGIGGIIVGIVVVIVIIAIIGVVIYFVSKNKSNVNTGDLLNKQTLEEAALLGGFNKFLQGGFDNIINNPSNIFGNIKNTTTYKILIISILVLIIVILYKILVIHYSNQSDQPNNQPNQSNNQPNNQSNNQPNQLNQPNQFDQFDQYNQLEQINPQYNNQISGYYQQPIHHQYNPNIQYYNTNGFAY
nr:myristoylated membrane protein [Mimivirus sp.]